MARSFVSEKCVFCGGPVNPHDMSAWKEVTGFVGGPRKDSMRLRKDTGRFAHDSCVHKVNSGQSPDQPEITADVPASDPTPVSTDIEELFQ